MKNILLFGISILMLVSCSNKDKSEAKNQAQEPVQEQSQSEVFVFDKITPLNRKVANELRDWFDYNEMKNNVERYQETSKMEALMNAHDLYDAISKASDTISIPFLDKPEIKIRFNVMYNSAKRLDDMSTISSITSEEVKHEIGNMIEAYSSLNDKINALYTLRDYREELGIKDTLSIEELTKIEIDSI